MGLLRSKPNWRRQLLVVYCTVSLGMSGCAQRRITANSAPDAPQPKSEKAESPYHSVPPSAMAEYIRLVYSISQRSKADNSDSETQEDLDLLRSQTVADPSDLETRKILVNRLVERRLFGEALSTLGELAVLAPEDASVHVALARVWKELGRLDEALEHAQSAAGIDPASVEALSVAGQILIEQKRFQEAIVVLHRALTLSPGEPHVEASLGRAYVRTRSWLKARQHLLNAVQAKSSMRGPREDLAYTLAQLGEQDAALRYFTEVHNSEADGWNQLGVVFLSQERWMDARKAFRRALELQPAHTAARLHLSEAESYLPLPAVVSIPPFQEAKGVSLAAERGPVPAESLTKLPLDQTVHRTLAFLALQEASSPQHRAFGAPPPVREQSSSSTARKGGGTGAPKDRTAPESVAAHSGAASPGKPAVDGSTHAAGLMAAGTATETSLVAANAPSSSDRATWEPILSESPKTFGDIQLRTAVTGRIQVQMTELTLSPPAVPSSPEETPPAAPAADHRPLELPPGIDPETLRILREIQPQPGLDKPTEATADPDSSPSEEGHLILRTPSSDMKNLPLVTEMPTSTLPPTTAVDRPEDAPAASNSGVILRLDPVSPARLPEPSGSPVTANSGVPPPTEQVSGAPPRAVPPGAEPTTPVTPDLADAVPASEAASDDGPLDADRMSVLPDARVAILRPQSTRFLFAGIPADLPLLSLPGTSTTTWAVPNVRRESLRRGTEDRRTAPSVRVAPSESSSARVAPSLGTVAMAEIPPVLDTIQETQAVENRSGMATRRRSARGSALAAALLAVPDFVYYVLLLFFGTGAVAAAYMHRRELQLRDSSRRTPFRAGY